MNIISVGCVCADIFADENRILPGGESLNFCGNICGFPDVKCGIVSVIGNDGYGRAILEKISKYPVDTSFLAVRNGTTANHKIYHTKDGDRFFKEDSWDGGLYSGFALSDEAEAYVCGAEAVHTTVDCPAFSQVIECKKKSGFMLAVDFNEYRDLENWEKFLGCVDLFFISGNEGIFAKLKRLAAKYGAVFVCTMAENGSVAFSGEKEYSCPAVKVDAVVDTTGAGDSFQAGFVREYFGSRDIDKSLFAGSRLAAGNIRRLGGF